MASPVSSISDKNTTDPLYQVKILAALRSGDPALIHPFLTDIAAKKHKLAEGESDIAAATLHLAVRCASCDTVALLLSHRSISPNAIHPPDSGTTPLHVAASLSRVDVVNLLLDQDGIDDTLRDNNNKNCREVARSKDVVRAIDDSRSFLTASYRSLLRSYILSSANSTPPQALLDLLSSPRIKLVDLSYIDDSSGTTLLHAAAKRKDLRLVELSIRAGADVFVRDRKGRGVCEGTGKDDRVRVFLRQFANYDTTLLSSNSSPSSPPPSLKGYLNKYANVAKGYNTRWFVLREGTLSYYRNQDDENVASRGSIAMKSAVLRPSPGSNGLRFEIHHTPSRRNQGVQKWYLKANHPVEATRWIQAINKNVEWYKNDERPSVESSHGTPSLRGGANGSTFSGLGVTKKSENASGHQSASSSMVEEDHSPNIASSSSRPDLLNEDLVDNSSDEFISGDKPPFDPSFAIQGNYVHVNMGLIAEHLQEVLKPEGPSDKLVQSADQLKDSVANVRDMLEEYLEMVRQREEWWKSQLKREQQRQDVWEKSLQAVVREGELLEQELRSRTRRKSRMSSEITRQASGTLKQKPSNLPTAETIFESPPSMSPEPSSHPTMVIPRSISTEAQLESNSTVTTPTAASVERNLYPMGILALSPDTELYPDTDEEDEFFDAIETNNLPNLIISRALNNHEDSVLEDIKMQYAGYQNLRKSLSISTDNRPPTSLWSVLKNSIGKDLTRISFPVFFNEPTSMLQRMAEDMEFPECLDAASNEPDPLKRIAYVAAFAMSNYSSTIGRIAKPFNPMLGETFEYVHVDQEYRYVSEQVSHHPPISACWAESPYWRYYGEVDAQNKFMGKSFEIRPTGVAHAEVILPSSWAPDYPPDRPSVITYKENKVYEHYSWKKVTTNVSGFILGSPTIDHYGDMTVRNHRTGDTCTLIFKPRGWRGKDAFEISGSVTDSKGKLRYEIAGRWNSQLIARAVGTGTGHLHPDVSNVQSPEYILLWRNSAKPKAPFNLTPFAITLNDCPEDTLKPVLCPTDCRLRPDQRAFELGKYERANVLKMKQEEKQRVTRKAREEGRLSPHKPRWFTAETEPDTGERVWMPSRVDNVVEYWVERELAWKAVQSGSKAHWKDMEDIFIDDEP